MYHKYIYLITIRVCTGPWAKYITCIILCNPYNNPLN